MIQINLFNTSTNQRRWPLLSKALHEFSNIKEENKSKVKLVVYYNSINKDNWYPTLEKLANGGINLFVVELDSDEYTEKLKYAELCDTEYFCKWDDDIFISRYVWDYMIENVDILNDNDISVIAPTFSNGIPSIELFIKDFLTDDEKKYVGDLFLKQNIHKNIWGGNFNSVYDYIKSMVEWDGDSYWKFVESIDPMSGTTNLPWYYYVLKGIHPGRFSYEYNMFVANHAINNIDKIMNKNEFYFDKYTTPYFCNNLFICKTSFYKESRTLFNDGWDEGQLTVLADRMDRHPVYVRNCYGIHMAYGCTERQIEIEDFYMDKLFSIIK